VNCPPFLQTLEQYTGRVKTLNASRLGLLVSTCINALEGIALSRDKRVLEQAMKAIPASANHKTNRRQFLGSTGAAAIGLTILKPQLVFGAEANRKIDLGLIGCGGRGQWIANLFKANGNYNFVAAADYFQDKVDAAGEKLGIAPEHRFSGLSGYKRLLEQKLDAVVIETPPYFHPEQAAAAVDAGKHVYVAKPIAVNVPGCRTIEASGKEATGKKLCFQVDFQTRAHPSYQEAVKRVRDGQIGRIVSVEASYHCGPTWGGMDTVLRKDPKNSEVRLRAWGVDRVLSGDVITEQNIHALDVATWFLDAAPVRAYGTGGRARDFIGDCWDHFAVVFYFPNEVVVSFDSKQVGHGFDDIQCRVFGMDGTADTHYGGDVWVRSKDDLFNGGKTGSIFTDGVQRNIVTFYESITKGDYSNPSVAPSVRSNLTTILGRTAAYKKAEVTWEEMMRANEKLQADLKGLKA
jgi:myo-inositol 2-dehydrogenase/D-chiro-inositol 1-dehydrogenase